MSAASSLILLDTCVLIHLARGGELGEKIARDHSLRARPDKPLVAVVTVGECFAFAKKRGWGAGKTRTLEEIFRELVVVDISPQIVLDKYAAIDAWAEQNGKALGQNDVWIAAIAAATGALLLTNDRDFDPLDGLFLSRVYIEPKV